MQKKILYVDMDGVIADFIKEIERIYPDIHLINDHDEKRDKIDDIVLAEKDFFINLEPIENSIEIVNELFDVFDLYFLSTPMYNVTHSYSGKRVWLEKYFGEKAHKRLILTHRKDLNIGHYLVDDRLKNGADKFGGVHIHFGTEKFPTWSHVKDFLVSDGLHK